MIIFRCDRCGAKLDKRMLETDGNPAMLQNTIDKRYWDLCPTCFVDFEAFIKNSPKKPEPKKAAAPKKTVARKKLDSGKIYALADAGWSVKKISEELGCSDQAVRNHLEARNGKN